MRKGENELQKKIIAKLERHGAIVKKLSSGINYLPDKNGEYMPYMANSGGPDLLIVGHSNVVFVEVKIDKNSGLRMEQAKRMDQLKNHGIRTSIISEEIFEKWKYLCVKGDHTKNMNLFLSLLNDRGEVWPLISKYKTRKGDC